LEPLSDEISSGEKSSLDGLSLEQLECVLQATRDIMVAYGAEAVTLEMVASVADLDSDGRSALLAHFADGATLFIEFGNRVRVPLREAISDLAMSSGESMTDSMLAMCVQWVEYVRQDVHLFLAFRDLVHRAPPTVSEEIVEAARGFDRLFLAVTSAIVAEGQLRGELREGDPRVFTLGLMAIYNGLLMMMADPRGLVAEGVYIEDLARSVCTTFIAGLAT
jgi:AcrR family transcriptional regulator